MYRVAICDDERDFCEELRRECGAVLDELGVEHGIDVFFSAQELADSMSSGEGFDLLLLDICMDGKNGMDLAHELRRGGDGTSIIFISGSDAYLREGYTVSAIRYLAKPVDPEELREAIKCDIFKAKVPRLVTFRRHNRTTAVLITDILYVESRDHGIYLHTKDGEQFFHMSLTEAEGLLPSENFCRCHNSFLVNMAAIAEIGRRWVTLKNDATIPIGRHYYEQAQLRFVRYLNSNT